MYGKQRHVFRANSAAPERVHRALPAVHMGLQPPSPGHVWGLQPHSHMGAAEYGWVAQVSTVAAVVPSRRKHEQELHALQEA